MTTHNLNFLPCFTVAVNPVNPTMADVGINLAPVFECDIDEFGVISFTLSICDQVIDMSCIATTIFGTMTLQDVCDNGNTTTTDIEIVGNTQGVILTSTDGTRHRVTLMDNGAGSYALDIGPTLP
jgi:hypothetical protein